jgi:hypothetical protein
LPGAEKRRNKPRQVIVRQETPRRKLEGEREGKHYLPAPRGPFGKSSELFPKGPAGGKVVLPLAFSLQLATRRLLTYNYLPGLVAGLFRSEQ